MWWWNFIATKYHNFNLSVTFNFNNNKKKTYKSRQHNAHKVYLVFQVSDISAGTGGGRHAVNYSSNTL